MTERKSRQGKGAGDRQARGKENDAAAAAFMRAVVIHPFPRGSQAGRVSDASRASKQLPPEARLEEAIGLARAIDLEVCDSGLVPLSAPRPATLLGSGKVEELKGVILAHEAGLVIVDHALSPIQQRNLEKAWNAKVLDRTGLILEIFGARARTKEGRLQVELAHLMYQRSRLVRTWTHLERQRGGFGFLGGPGETQIEADRRMIGDRIDSIKRELEGVRRTRELHRESRRRVPFPVVALAGYTNAGKSTLFNTLTQAEVTAQDQLFATLDPTMRRLDLPGGGKVILSDTVGFISELPTMLVAAFRATLEEVSEADIILHVRDIAAPYSEQQKHDVETVLAELGVEIGEDLTNIIEVWNKVDLLDDEGRHLVESAAARGPNEPMLISAATGEGLDRLKTRIEQRISAGHVLQTYRIPASQGALINWLYEHGDVRERRANEDGTVGLDVRLAQSAARRFEHLLNEAARE
jgi:GTP-binding protein HflX